MMLSLYLVALDPNLHFPYLEDVREWGHWFSRDSKDAWETLCKRVEIIEASPQKNLCVEAAAVGSVLRKLTFGGVVRKNKHNKQNAPLVNGQIEKLVGWEPTLELHKIKKEVHLRNDFRRAIEAFLESKFEAAEALIDPPYYAPRSECPRTQTATYWGHEPHSVRTKYLCTNAVRMCCEEARFKRIVVTNYLSKDLDERLREIATQNNRQISFVSGKALKTMQRTTKLEDGVKQGFWEIV